MIPHLLDFLSSHLDWKVPQVFFYCSTRLLLASISAFLFTLFLAPSFIRKLYALKIGQPIRKDECPPLAELHKNKENTPTMGGILIIASLLLSMLLWMDLSHVFTLMLFFTIICLTVVGGMDDYLKLKYRNAKGISGKKKLLVQGFVVFVISLYFFTPGVAEFFDANTFIKVPLIKNHYFNQLGTEARELAIWEYAGNIFIPFIKHPILSLSGIGLIFGAILSFFVVVGTSNAVNLTDGLDGLATGCILTACIPFILFGFFSNNIEISNYLNISYVEGSGEIAICLASLFGASLGFLWYNGYPAQVFMGDVGSLTMGGLIGVCALLLKREFLLALVGGIFVAEAISVMLQVLSFRYRNKKRVFLCAPLHHHFEYKGWPETKVVIRFWIISLILSILGILSLKMQ